MHRSSHRLVFNLWAVFCAGVDIGGPSYSGSTCSICCRTATTTCACRIRQAMIHPLWSIERLILTCRDSLRCWTITSSLLGALQSRRSQMKVATPQKKHLPRCQNISLPTCCCPVLNRRNTNRPASYSATCRASRYVCPILCNRSITRRVVIARRCMASLRPSPASSSYKTWSWPVSISSTSAQTSSEPEPKWLFSVFVLPT